MTDVETALKTKTVPQLRTLARDAGLTTVPAKKADLVAALVTAAKLAKAGPTPATGKRTATGHARIDHSACQHPRTFAGRDACRRAVRAAAQ